MNILLTGASGFLGSTLIKNLNDHHIVSLGRGQASDIVSDLATEVPRIVPVEVIIHAAGKAHTVPKTEEEKQLFFDVNLNGTQNLLKSIEEAGKLPRSFIFISSVAVYGVDAGLNIPESHPLNAKDPYGISKIQAEQLIQEWCKEKNVICSILRLPLLAGPKPPGNLGAMIKGIKKGYYFNIAGGLAKKSVVLTDDISSIIPALIEKGGVYNLTDGENPSFFELSEKISNQLQKPKPFNMPLWIAGLIAAIGDIVGRRFPLNSSKLKKITADLTFDDTKARNVLGWKPKRVLDDFRIE